MTQDKKAHQNACSVTREAMHLGNWHREAVQVHLGECPACVAVASQIERLDDALLEWRAPEPATDLADRVLANLSGQGEVGTCEDALEDLHHFISGDLEPWRASTVERHLEGCQSCLEAHRESIEARETWQQWKAPSPPEDLVERVSRDLSPPIRRLTRRREEASRPWFLADFRMPRLAAALLLMASLLSIGTLFVERQRSNSPVINSRPPIAATPVTTRHAPSLGVVGFYGDESGEFEVSNSFSSSFGPSRGRLLRTARR